MHQTHHALLCRTTQGLESIALRLKGGEDLGERVDLRLLDLLLLLLLLAGLGLGGSAGSVGLGALATRGLSTPRLRALGTLIDRGEGLGRDGLVPALRRSPMDIAGRQLPVNGLEHVSW